MYFCVAFGGEAWRLVVVAVETAIARSGKESKSKVVLKVSVRLIGRLIKREGGS